MPDYHIDPPWVAPPGMSERMIQRSMLVMVRRLFPDCLVAHVPNGGKRNKLEAAHLVADGVLAGFPDLVVTWAGSMPGAAFPEIKDANGTLSAAQKKVLATLAAQGHHVGVFRHDRTLHDFLRAVGAPFRPKHAHSFLPRHGPWESLE